MNWLAWKQHRLQIIIIAIMTACFIAFMIVNGNVADSDTKTLNNLRASLIIPFLLGIFWGAPLLSKEYEDGTNNFIWMQGISRARWLTTKLVLLLIPAAIYGLAIGLYAYGWWPEHPSRFGVPNFDVTGIVPAFHNMFAVVLGAVVGAYWKRVIPAIAVTFAVLVATNYVVVNYVRPHFMEPVTYTYKITGCKTTSTTDGGSSRICSSPGSIPGYKESQDPSNWILEYPHGGDGTLSTTVYQPGNRYWRFQAYESATYAVLTVAGLATAYRRILQT